MSNVKDEVPEDRPLLVGPGHVRARAHYEAMLAELLAEQE